VSVSPGSTGARGGLRVLQLSTPHQRGYVEVDRQVAAAAGTSGNAWILRVSNVDRIGYEAGAGPQPVLLMGQGALH